MQKLRALSINLKEKLFVTFLSIIGSIIGLAALITVFFMILQIAGRYDIINKINDEVSWRFDNIYKDVPGNIFYDENEDIWVESVTNQVKIGRMAGNRNLEFGVKNILEEYLQESEFELLPNAKNKLKVEIIYLDVLTTKKNVSVFHKNEEEVVIRMKGVLFKDGKKEKEVLVEESSSEISMSTLIIDEGGKFNQTSLSNAIKKACNKIISKLTEK